MTEPNWAGGWRPAGYRPWAPPEPDRGRPRHGTPRPAARGAARRPERSRSQKAALRALRLTLDGLARALVLLARLCVALVGLGLRLLLPRIGAAGAAKRIGRIN